MFAAPMREHTPENAGPFADVFAGTGDKVQASTTTAFARLLRNLLRDPDIGSRIVPIIPDEARTFGLDALFREYKIYAPFGQRYEPVDAELLLSYREASNGRILEEGITEAGSMATLTAAGTSYATWGQPMIPFFIFYSMFGFQRVGDLIWSFGDQRGRGLPARRHRRAHHARRRGPAALRRPEPAARVRVPELRGVRPRVRVRDGRHHPRRHRAHVRPRAGRLLLLHHPLQRELPDAGDARGRRGRHRARAVPVPGGAGGRERRRDAAQILASGTAMLAALDAQQILADEYGVAADVWSATSYKMLREEALTVERWNRLHPTEPARTPYVTEHAARQRRARSSRSPTS